MLKVLVTQVWNHSRSAFQKRIEYCIRGKAVTNWVMQKNLSFVYVSVNTNVPSPIPPPPRPPQKTKKSSGANDVICMFVYVLSLECHTRKPKAQRRRMHTQGVVQGLILVMPRDQLILFSVKRKFRTLFSWFYVTREEPEFSSDIRDFTSLFYVILRRKSSQWLESWMQSDLGMWFAILSQSRYCLLQTLFLV